MANLPTDLFYGGTMDIQTAQNWVDNPGFIHFMFHVYGTGYSEFYLSCYVVHGPDRIRCYDKFPLNNTSVYKWSNVNDPGKSFSFAKLIMNAALFKKIVDQNTIPQSNHITIYPTGIKTSEIIPDYNYLAYGATKGLLGSGDDNTYDLNPSPPY